MSLYLHIMSAFVLGGISLDTGLNESLLATATIAIIVVIEVIFGLKKLETLEQWGLYITLVIILLLIGGFAKYTLAVAGSATGLIGHCVRVGDRYRAGRYADRRTGFDAPLSGRSL